MNTINKTDNSVPLNAVSLYGPDEEEKKKKNNQLTRLQQTSSQLEVKSPELVPPGSAKPVDYMRARADVAGMKTRLNSYRQQPPGKGKNESKFYETFKEIVAPKMTPERRMQMYVNSEEALETALGGSFGEDIKQRFKVKRQESEEKSENEYRNSVSVIGGNPEYGMYRAVETDDPIKDIESTIAETDATELAKRIAPLARHSGLEMEEYVNRNVLPKIYKDLFNEVIAEEKPKSSAEYIIRSSLGNSVVGKLGQLSRDLMTGSTTHTELQNEAMSSYEPGRIENFVSGIGSLIIDAPVFNALGMVAGKVMGGTANLLTKKLSTKILSSKLGEGMTRATADNMAQRIISNQLSHKILQSSGSQGLTLGGYDALNSMVDDILLKNDVDAGKAAGAFGKGLLTGGVLGLVGTPLRSATKGYTGAKKMLASAGVLSAESAVFTASSEIEKLKHGVDIEPLDIVNDFGESTATLLVMRMTHWRPKGAGLKLGTDGKLKKGFTLSNSEKAELRELNVNPEQFIAAIEEELKLPSFGGERSRYIREVYTSLMTNDKLSAAVKSKLLFLVENKLTSTPPIPFDFVADKRSDGKWEIELRDATGARLVHEVFDHAGNAKSYMIVHAAELRRNRIATFETELTSGQRSENFLRHAGFYAKKSGISIDDISTAIYKKSTGQEVSYEEQKIVDDILERSSYDEAGMVQMLYNVRRKIEKKYGLEKGTMFIDIQKPFFRLTEVQNKALDEYEIVLRDEVDRLKSGTEKRRSLRLLKQGLESEYFGMTNEEVIEREIQDHYDWVAIRDADRIGLRQKPRPSAPIRPIYIPPEDNSGYVWSYGEAKNTKEDIARYAKRAQEIGDKFNTKLNFIYDEREIKRPDPEDVNAVMEYNNQIVAEGWVHKGEVFINLPNAKNVETVEKTVFHETVAHKGLLGVFGDYLYDFLEDVYRKASPEVLRGINKIKTRYKNVDFYTLMEEYLAYLAENINTTRAERTTYNKIKDYIRSLLIRMNIYTGSNRQISETELLRIMKRHAEYMQKGTAPSEYMRDVFGSFRSAHHSADAYHNRAAYNEGIKSKIAQGKLLSSTPKPFRQVKEFMYYEFLPPEQQKAVRERYGYTDEQMRSYTRRDDYKLNDDFWNEYRPVGEKAASGTRGEEKWEQYNPLVNAGVNPAAPRYRMPDDLYRAYGDMDLLNPERQAAEKRNPDAVPVLKDPFYRSLKANSPAYSFVYEHLRELPLEKWDANDYKLWDTLVGMAENGAVRFALKDIVTDSKFLEDYPELAMVPVKISKELQVPVMYDSENNRILIDSRLYLYPQSKYYINAALQGVAHNFEERRKSVSRQVEEFNTRFKEKYENGMTFAKKITAMRKNIPGFDAGNSIAQLFKNEYGFMPEEFLERFPEMDDYLLYRVTRGMNGMLDTNLSPKGRQESEAAISKKIGKHRKFFWGPVEIIMDAAGSGGEGPLRVVSGKERENAEIPSTGLDMSEKEAMFLKASPELLRYYGIPDPSKKKDPTGWEEYKLIQEERKRKEKEAEEKEKELEREKRRLEIN